MKFEKLRIGTSFQFVSHQHVKGVANNSVKFNKNN